MMKKPTVNQKVEMLSDTVQEQIRDAIRKGESIRSISDQTGEEYAVVQSFCWREGILSLTGAKVYATLRLNKLVGARRQEDREKLVEEIKEKVNYIYDVARELTRQKEKVKKALELGA